MLDSWSLQVLVAVAESGSFSAAAEQLLMTQPGVSRQIAGLERKFGVPLFRREPRGVTPTEAGAEAVRLARVTLAQIDRFEATMRSFAGLDGAHLRLAGFASVNTHFVPRAIQRFSIEHPAVRVTLHHIDATDALDAVREGRIDLALVTGWQLTEDPVAARHSPDAVMLDPDDVAGVEVIELFEEQLHVALPADHRLSGCEVVPLRELRDERWIDGAYPDCLGPLPELGRALGASPEIGFFCDDWNGKQALVAAGAGVMVVPSLAGVAVRADLVLRPTAPMLPTRRLYAATARPPFRTPAVQAMLPGLHALAADTDGRDSGPSRNREAPGDRIVHAGGTDNDRKDPR